MTKLVGRLRSGSRHSPVWLASGRDTDLASGLYANSPTSSLGRCPFRPWAWATLLINAISMLGSSVAASGHEQTATSSPVQFTNGGSDSGWIPFEYFNVSKIFLPVTVNGHPTVALLDSASTANVVDAGFAAKIGLRPGNKTSGEGFGGSEAMSTAHFALTAGGMTIKASEAVIIDEKATASAIAHEMPVMLGGEAFRNATVDVDFEHRRLAFRDPAHFVAPAESQALQLSKGAIRALPMMVEGRPARMQFDLGNGQAVVLFQRYWKSAGNAGSRRISTTVSGGTGGFNIQKLTMLKDVRLGASVFDDVPAILQDGKGDLGGDQFDGNVGVGLLGRFHVIADFPHDRVFLVPPVDMKTAFRVNHTGLTLLRDGDAMVVRYVAPDSPASFAGLKINDRIVGVEEGASHKPVALTSPWTMFAVNHTLHLRLTDGRETTFVTGAYY